VDSGLVGVNSVNEKSTTSGNVVDGILDDRLDTGTLGDNVKSVYIVSTNTWLTKHLVTYEGSPS
jgi:hypothetical protein